MNLPIRVLLLNTLLSNGQTILVVESENPEYWLIKEFEDNSSNEIDGASMYKFSGYNITDFITTKLGQGSKSTMLELDQFIEEKKLNKVKLSKNQKISVYS